MGKRVLVNASNLHNGGGVQVAASFILELREIAEYARDCEFSVFASSEVDANLRSTGFDARSVAHYEVFDVHGLGGLKPGMSHKFSGFDVVFTVFGPMYAWRRLPGQVVGFAQPWIIYPDNEISHSLPWWSRAKIRAKYAVQWAFFRRAERLVVELQHVKNRLVALEGYPADAIDVVSNCVSSVFFDETRWMPIPGMPKSDGSVVRLGFVSRDYPHKNIAFLHEVAKALGRKSAIDFRFVLTLTDSEWQSHSQEFRNVMVNVGPITIAQCPTFYSQVDAVVFPSLLECFSATPLEAMMMGRPLFASDRGFVRDCCGEHALYFDPLDPEDAADCILKWFSGMTSDDRHQRIEGALRHVRSLPKAADRARAYVDIALGLAGARGN